MLCAVVSQCILNVLFCLFVDFCNLFFVLCFARVQSGLFRQTHFFLHFFEAKKKLFRRPILNKLRRDTVAASFVAIVSCFVVAFYSYGKAKKTTEERPSWWPVFQGWNNGAMNIIYVYWFRCWVRDGVVWALLLYDGCMCILQYIFSFLFHYYTAFVSICFSSLLQLISIRIFCSISLSYVACIRIEFGTMECHDYCVLIENYCLYTQTRIQIENCFSE